MEVEPVEIPSSPDGKNEKLISIEQKEQHLKSREPGSVEKILARKIENDQKVYLVKWKGIPESESTWEPADNLLDVIEFIVDFEVKDLLKESAQDEKIDLIDDSLEKQSKRKASHSLSDDEGPVKKVKSENLTTESVQEKQNRQEKEELERKNKAIWEKRLKILQNFKPLQGKEFSDKETFDLMSNKVRLVKPFEVKPIVFKLQDVLALKFDDFKDLSPKVKKIQEPPKVRKESEDEASNHESSAPKADRPIAIKPTGGEPRKRGRPKKNLEEKMALLQTIQSMAKRPRGRPKKITTEMEIEKKDSKENDEIESSQRRGRGRPRKSKTLNENKEAVQTPERKKRGRPRKVGVSYNSSDNKLNSSQSSSDESDQEESEESSGSSEEGEKSSEEENEEQSEDQKSEKKSGEESNDKENKEEGEKKAEDVVAEKKETELEVEKEQEEKDVKRNLTPELEKESHSGKPKRILDESESEEPSPSSKAKRLAVMKRKGLYFRTKNVGSTQFIEAYITTPNQKKRGRPPKVKPEPVNEGENKKDNVEGSTIVRKRGRPPKNKDNKPDSNGDKMVTEIKEGGEEEKSKMPIKIEDDEEQEEKIQSVHSISDDDQTDEVVEMPVLQPRKRGRPPKHDKVVKEKVVAPAGQQPRKRGRPRKYNREETKENQEEKSPVEAKAEDETKKRGRPFKISKSSDKENEPQETSSQKGELQNITNFADQPRPQQQEGIKQEVTHHGENGAVSHNKAENSVKSDKPKEIIKVKMESNNEIGFLVRWEPREDGEQPQDSFISNHDLKKHHPLLLIDYYEGIIKEKRMNEEPTKNDEEIIPVDSSPEQFGSFAYHDKPMQIVRIKSVNPKGCEFLVRWHSRPNDVQPLDSVVTSESFKNHDPDFLTAYYESKVKLSPDEEQINNSQMDVTNMIQIVN